jgi:ribosomal protein S18 acetylase RimI-like enzyme
MIVLEPITPRNLLPFQAIRLAALKTDPLAFGSTYEREARFTFHDWIQRVNRWNGETGIGYLAIDGSEPCGIAGGLLEESDRARAQLVSMWTAPAYRRQAVGSLLVNAVIAWARQRGAHTLTLTVTENNDRAIRFYERLGFATTGRTEPYPNDDRLRELEMALVLDGGLAPTSLER